MKCPNCSSQIKTSFTYCPYCGFNIKKLLADQTETLKLAQVLLKTNEYEDAIFLLKTSSRLGNSEAMYEYGLLFAGGVGTEKNDNNVIYCMTKSAEYGNDKANLFLIDVYLNGKFGQKADNNKAIQLFNKLSKECQENNANLLEKLGLGDEKNDYNSSAAGDFNISRGGVKTVMPFKVVVPSSNSTVETIFNEENDNLQKFYVVAGKTIDLLKNEIEYIEPVDLTDDKYEWEIKKRERNEHLRNEIQHLNKALANPYIGKMSFKNEDVYVGRELIYNECNQPIVYSWYSELGNKIYDDYSTSWLIKGKSYVLEKKRNIEIKDKKLIKVTETFNRNLHRKPISDAFLLEILKKRHNESKVSDIINSIQYEQNTIITYDSSKNLIMQGCAGSGKTMILFHRIKYIIGNNISPLAQIAVLTPNVNFNNYIQPLLRDLNITNVSLFSVPNYYLNILNSFVSDSDNRWDDLFNKSQNFIGKKLIIKNDDELPASVVNEYYSNAFFDAVGGLESVGIKPLHRNNFFKEKAGVVNPEIDIMASVLGAKELNLLPKYERSSGVIHKCELYALCLFYYRRCGGFTYKEKKEDQIKNYNKRRFKYMTLMIDEAQDLSVGEYRLIKAINDGIVVNLFGDVEQATATGSLNSWSDIDGIFGEIDKIDYNKNYRNTIEIVNYVNKKYNKNMQGIGYSDYAVKEINERDIDKLFNFDGNNNKIIIGSNKNCEKHKIDHPNLKEWIIPISMAKGLEYASVYVYADELTEKEGYIACTRALNKLTIIKNNSTKDPRKNRWGIFSFFKTIF